MSLTYVKQLIDITESLSKLTHVINSYSQIVIYCI